MRKENLETGAKFKVFFAKRAPTWLGRLFAVALIASVSSQRYHGDVEVDKTQDEPKSQLIPKNLEELNWIFPLSEEIEFAPDFEKPTQQPPWQMITEPTAAPKEQVVAEAAKSQFNSQELGVVLEKISQYAETFSQGDSEDVKLYFLIYEAAAQKFRIPWYLLWIIHSAESTVSANPAAFDPGNLHYGAMGRAVNYHFAQNVDYAAVGLEHLAALPQRHFDDWAEIAWSAMKLREDWDSTGSLESALSRYTVVLGPIYYQNFLFYQNIFEN